MTPAKNSQKNYRLLLIGAVLIICTLVLILIIRQGIIPVPGSLDITPTIEPEFDDLVIRINPRLTVTIRIVEALNLAAAVAAAGGEPEILDLLDGNHRLISSASTYIKRDNYNLILDFASRFNRPQSNRIDFLNALRYTQIPSDYYQIIRDSILSMPGERLQYPPLTTGISIFKNRLNQGLPELESELTDLFEFFLSGEPDISIDLKIFPVVAFTDSHARITDGIIVEVREREIKLFKKIIRDLVLEELILNISPKLNPGQTAAAVDLLNRNFSENPRKQALEQLKKLYLRILNDDKISANEIEQLKLSISLANASPYSSYLNNLLSNDPSGESKFEKIDLEIPLIQSDTTLFLEYQLLNPVLFVTRQPVTLISLRRFFHYLAKISGPAVVIASVDNLNKLENEDINLKLEQLSIKSGEIKIFNFTYQNQTATKTATIIAYQDLSPFELLFELKNIKL